jgi:hypothetical protein
MTDADSTETPPTGPAAAARPPGVPRWVKVTGVVVLLLVAILVVSKFAGVEHGPGRHSGSDDSPGQTQPAGTGGHTGPPPGVTHGSP